MTDTWEKRAVAYTPGYNTPGNTLAFTPVYNSGTDELVITASHPVFGPVDEINFQGTFGSGTMNVGVEFVVDSPTQITVSGAAAVLSAPTDLTQLDFFSPGPTLVGTWTGNVNIPAPVPAIEITFAFVGQINKNDSSGLGSVIPAEIASAFGEPGVGLAVTYNTKVDADIGIVRIVTDIGTFDFSPPGGFGATFGTDSGQFLVSGGALAGALVQSVELLDWFAASIDTFDASPDQEIYDVASASWAGTTLTIDFNGTTKTGAPAQVNVGELLVSNTYAWGGSYNPLSPEVVQWDDDAIVINDPVEFTGPNIATANLLQVLGPQGYWAAYNSQIPWP